MKSTGKQTCLPFWTILDYFGPIWTICFNQVGVEKTGGQMVLGDSFGQSVFKESLSRLFRKPLGEDGQPLPVPPPEQGGGAALLQMGFGATMEVGLLLRVQ